MTSKVCGQKECGNPASHRIFWPGRRAEPVCQEHRLAAIRVADALGLELVIEPLDWPAET
jgi:hypothetical protein